ncbi:MAG: hypothetical protein Q7S82_01325 [bacterium]|nr:hypothetical protein [bacterium]
MKKLDPKIVEKKLQDLIDRYKIGDKLNIEKVKSFVFNDEGAWAMDASNRFNKKFFDYFTDSPDSGDDFFNIFKIATDAWNAFPHKSLKGMSPQEMFEKESKKIPRSTKKDQNKMPKVIMGGREMSWEEHQAMLKEMEKHQKPFKEFIEKEIIPSYKIFFEEQAGLSKEVKEKYILVAEKFFDRVLWVGFVDYEMIRLELAKDEFPSWWQTHVMFSRLDESQVWMALRHLINFIKIRYGLEMKGRKD